MSTVSQVPQTKQTCSDEANVDHTTLAGNLGPKVSQCKLPTKIWSPSTLESQPIHTEDPRTEPHGRNFEYLYPATLGIADGITVPFAVMASLTVLNDRHIVVIGGLAELFAGALSMGLGQFMTALLKREHFLSEEAREKMEIESKPEEEEAEIHEILERYGVSDHVAHMVVDDLKANPLLYLQFMMDFELKIGKTTYREATMEGVVMAVSYALGGLMPMVPYLAIKTSMSLALYVSIGVTAVLLMTVGFLQAVLFGCTWRRGTMHAIRVFAIGASAAGVSYGFVKALHQ